MNLLLQLLLVDKKITNPKELLNILNSAVKEKFPILIVAEGIEQDALAPIIKNKLRGVLKVAAIKAPAFGERKSHNLEDIAILTGGIRSISQFNLEACILFADILK
jgi:chaperonin GroEL